jgi:hypothetical protein
LNDSNESTRGSKAKPEAKENIKFRVTNENPRP